LSLKQIQFGWWAKMRKVGSGVESLVMSICKCPDLVSNQRGWPKVTWYWLWVGHLSCNDLQFLGMGFWAPSMVSTSQSLIWCLYHCCRPSTTTKLTILTIFFHPRVVTTFKLTIFFHPWVVTPSKLTIFFHPRVVTTFKLTIFFHPRVVTTSKLTIFFHLRVVTTSKLTIFFHPRVVTTSKLTIFFHPLVVTTSGHHLV
jgi:hypothetical protein